MATRTISLPGARRAVAAAERPLHTDPATVAPPIGDRRLIETAIDMLIQLLDQQDGDPDAEPDVDREPDEAPGFCITPAGRRALAEGWS